MIELDASQLSHIRTIAERTYPDECCGLLVGRRLPAGAVAVSRIVESRNVHPARTRDRFEVDPQVRIAIERSLRDSDECVVGHYHSHPDHPARPSETDLAMAFEPELIWLIVSVVQARADAIGAFRVNASRTAFDVVEIREQAEPNG